jgi:hypothetical protein
MVASHVGTDWQDQWTRVQRWHNRVRAIGAGGGGDQEWALDLVFAFFMNCYHLRDWLIDSKHSTKEVVDAHIAGSEALVWCRDICNGMKHYRLDPVEAGSGLKPIRTTPLSFGAPQGRRGSDPARTQTLSRSHSRAGEHARVRRGRWVAGRVGVSWLQVHQRRRGVATRRRERSRRREVSCLALVRFHRPCPSSGRERRQASWQATCPALRRSRSRRTNGR